MCLLLSGCFVKTVDELYTLPRHSDAYYDLQKALDKLMQEGMEWSAPVGGINQQSVQLSDLDGDSEDEAIAFLRKTGENSLCVCIFDRIDGAYQNIAVIEGAGSAFFSVDYAQIDGEGGAECIVGRQLSDQVLQSLSVYTLTGGRVVELMSENYTDYRTTDLDGDGLKDLFLLRFDTEQRHGVGELYRWKNGQLEREPEAMMTQGAESVKRIVTGQLMQDVPAVFVASVYDGDNILTDIFAFRDDVFCNVAASGSDKTVQTLRSYFVYAADIDFDGLIELPELIPLARTQDEEDFSLIQWYNLDLYGNKKIRRTTYHSFSGGWYVEIPEPWLDSIAIQRSDEVSGVRGYSFCERIGQKQAVPIFTLYAFSGEDRTTLAQSDGRVLISEKGDISYSASIGDSRFAAELDTEALKKMFNYIHVEWNSGET